MGYDYSYIDALGALADYYIIASIFSLISTIAAIIVATIIAKKKGRSGGWGWLALLIGWIAVIIVACLPSENKSTSTTYGLNYKPTTTQTRWTCLYCNESNHPNATACTTCGKEKVVGWKCTNCNSVNTAKSLFCSNCGNSKQNKWKCKECNILNDPNNSYCNNCGSKKPE